MVGDEWTNVTDSTATEDHHPVRDSQDSSEHVRVSSIDELGLKNDKM